MTSAFRFPAIRSEVPPIEKWSRFMARADERNWFTNFGELSVELEHQFMSRWGFEGSAAICTNNGTSAIAAPLIAAGVAGAAVIPAFTFPATLSAVKMAGLSVALMDVAEDTWTVSPDTLDRALATTKASAAVLVSPFGLKCDFSQHIGVARAHGAQLVIDSAAALGVSRDNVEASSHVFEAYSLHATKPFGIGEGGVVFCAADMAARMRSALNFGLPTRFGTETSNWGINGKLSEAHAAVGLTVFEDFDARLQRRRSLAERYMKAFEGIAGIRYVQERHRSAWQVFPVLMPDERSCSHAVERAAQLGMEVRRYYRPSLTRWLTETSCPISDSIADRMICFPVYSCDDETAHEMARIAQTALSEG